MSRPAPARAVRPVGASAALIECIDPDEASALAAWIVQGFGPALRDVVPAMRTVLVVASTPAALTSATTAAAVARPERGSRPEAGPVRIEVDYHGPDLAECAQSLNLSVEGLVRAHLAASWRVAFIGFAPGFAYLIADDWPHRLPRLGDPRPQVPAGSVALADGFSGIYPGASPGGWRLIGRTETSVWDVGHEPPTPFAPGIPVVFAEVRR